MAFISNDLISIPRFELITRPFEIEHNLLRLLDQTIQECACIVAYLHVISIKVSSQQRERVKKSLLKKIISIKLFEKELKPLAA